MGRRGVWEDDHAESGNGNVELLETEDFALFDEERTRRDGTGETR